ncbi:Ribosomal RNA small subunit methyltransferase H [Planctomycetes bacterium CA13]|uniref:Ribosomal RNA small subunit methyltransferase H n=1 Tax=Novipirellula herctigrandis TaxID=2527986 RepID=A0A5C5YP97_9BACT|nr:Ribosomal RNA small subunit methyltransferase H [Planctomycetes bacterium CA13]
MSDSPLNESPDARRSDAQKTESCHVSVMPDEVIQWLMESDPAVIVDGTYGGGGHSKRLLDQLPMGEGVVIGLDRDPAVSERVETESHDPRLHVFLASYDQTPKALAQLNLTVCDAFVLDLGLSSDQLADRNRGFSFTQEGPLDLRFDPENGTPASKWLAIHNEKQIADTIYQYGEERFSRRIARAIVARARERNPVESVVDLVEICRRCVPRSRNHDIHPATRTFQALRIAVNDELGILERTLQSAPNWLAPGGRVAVISFHSLEDRIVKNAFRDDDAWEVLTKKPLRPTESEVTANPRSRSAKMRVARRR